MKTLSREFTANIFYTDPSSYAAIKTAYREYQKTRRAEKKADRQDKYHTNQFRHDQNAAAVNLIYHVLLGKDWTKGYNPITNPVKLANGGLAEDGFNFAVGAATNQYRADNFMEPFKGFVKPDAFKTICLIINKQFGEEPYNDYFVKKVLAKAADADGAGAATGQTPAQAGVVANDNG